MKKNPEKIRMIDRITPDDLLDCRALSCPMPILRTIKAISTMKSGQILEVQSTDPGTKNDLPILIREKKIIHRLLIDLPKPFDLSRITIEHDKRSRIARGNNIKLANCQVPNLAFALDYLAGPIGKRVEQTIFSF